MFDRSIVYMRQLRSDCLKLVEIIEDVLEKHKPDPYSPERCICEEGEYPCSTVHNITKALKESK